MTVPPLEELFVLGLLLLGVVGVYYALKLHYIFAFNLVKNTSVSENKKQKIAKIKIYIFAFLKVLLFVSLVAMLTFSLSILNDEKSLKLTVLEAWRLIPEGFWTHALWVLLRIGLLIIVMKYILKMIYKFLDKQEAGTLSKKHYESTYVKKVYSRVHNTIKYTVVLGVVYRIVHFFPFLEEVSYVFLMALVLFFTLSLSLTLREIVRMHKG